MGECVWEGGRRGAEGKGGGGGYIYVHVYIYLRIERCDDERRAGTWARRRKVLGAREGISD